VSILRKAAFFAAGSAIGLVINIVQAAP